ncbi:hypothetical protein A3G14_05405 [Candidatus Curtissbacteria bacterium RIFCSPLOWO2_12_FULL_38_9]|uniref:Glycosyltransferase RgtA/B/C/D-like domain-containing protein n=1 Tax=Candidatus Curtissbacteria bacterium RIFCSPLOWO2_12_FULL_38_9 TaxID=1797735 RepID=A0A1F5IAJ0_9BACT|nr:MAG: hypothetical protein A3G14_05405 [Candidatus Curtissbacteria bacterium RIFCSPLOWO2_12_FULL_38_9]
MIKKIILLFLIWKIVVFIPAIIGPYVINDFGYKFPYAEILQSSNLPYWLWSFGNFDGVHYIRIAQDGYAYQFTQAFFPFYPILIKLVSYLTFGNFLISALLISNLAFLAGLLIFYKLVKKNYGQKTAFWSCLFLLAFPTSFYFGAVYTEGIFFLMIVATFYLLEEKKILLASIIGTFASATRLVGVFLAPALIKKMNFKSLIPLLVVPIGLVIYMIYLKIEFNNPLYFLTAQSVWGQERSTTGIVLLPQVFWRYFKILMTTSGLPLFNAALELAATIFALIILTIATKRVKREWLIFSWLAVLTPTLTGTLTSVPRYILIAFPIYIVLAQIKNTNLKILILAMSLIILFIATALFSRGYWIA